MATSPVTLSHDGIVLNDGALGPHGEAIKALKERLSEYDGQVAELRALLDDDPSNDDVTALLEQVQQAIQITRKELHEAHNNARSAFIDKLTPGMLCEVQYEDQHWYTCRIEGSTHTGTAIRYTVHLIGYETEYDCGEHRLRPFQGPPQSALQPGKEVQAVWSQDGKFYPAVIDKPTTKGTVWVAFKGFTDLDEVPLTHVQLADRQFNPQLGRKRAAEDPIADKARTAEEMQRAKKKQKAEKYQARIKEVEKAKEEGKADWQKFSNKLAGKGLKAGMFNAKNRESQFKPTESQRTTSAPSTFKPLSPTRR